MASLPDPPYRLALLGAGRVGTAVALLLRRRGHQVVGVASRSRAGAKRAAARLATTAFDPPDLPPADVYLIGTPDAAIPEAVVTLSQGQGEGRVVVHFAGSLGVAPLQPAIDKGAEACALHPVQACPDVDTAVARLPGSAWGVTSTPGAQEWAARLIAEDLDGRAVPIAENDRALWHAAAAITSNGIAALLSESEAVLAAIGVASPETVLGPLAAGTVANAVAGGGGGLTLTGPVVRGEAATIARHLDALRASAPDLLPAYAAVARMILAAARRAGRVDPDREAALGDLLEAS